jgi:hypothetical protein
LISSAVKAIAISKLETKNIHENKKIPQRNSTEAAVALVARAGLLCPR